MSIYINGRFLTQKITGVQRYAIEVIKELDKMNIKEEIIILHPKNTIQNLELKNIKLKEIGKFSGHLWEQISLAFFMLKQKNAKLLSMCNIAPILYPGYVTLHDISFKTHPEHLNWKFALWYKIITKLNIRRYKKIYTVSEFSKNEILDNYKVPENKIMITYDSAEHIKSIEKDFSIINKLDLENKKFIFSLGSKSPHKNHKYIIECAKNNPELLFVVSGNNNNKVFNSENDENIDNLIYTGYLTDEELSACYSKCYAFLFPSLYEGFGIPPLEAIEMGCRRILLSDIPVLKEIYGDAVNYIKKDEMLLSYDKLKEMDDEQVSLIKKKYNWEDTAKKIIFSITNER